MPWLRGRRRRGAGRELRWSLSRALRLTRLSSLIRLAAVLAGARGLTRLALLLS